MIFFLCSPFCYYYCLSSNAAVILEKPLIDLLSAKGYQARKVKYSNDPVEDPDCMSWGKGKGMCAKRRLGSAVASTQSDQILCLAGLQSAYWKFIFFYFSSKTYFVGTQKHV